MATDVITTLAGSLDAELEKARATLQGVDDSIKKLFGKDVSELNAFGRNRRGNIKPSEAKDGMNFDYDASKSYNRIRRRDDFDHHDQDEPIEKRRRTDISMLRPSPVVIGPRIRPRNDSEEEDRLQGIGGGGRRLASRIVSGKEKSREEVLAEQRGDRKGRDRNRRMFGALLGTLQRFKQEETKLKDKEEKRAQIEAKLDEAAKKEREDVKKEKLQLIRDRKLKITEIKRLEIKRSRIAELEQWEAKTKYLTNFIRTEAKPHIFYMPKIMNPIMECRLEQSKQYVTEMISSKRKLVLEDLENFEQRSKRYWERRVDGRETRRMDVDPMDEDIEEELKEIMKNEDLASVEAEDFTVTVYHEAGSTENDKSEISEEKKDPKIDEMKENVEVAETTSAPIEPVEEAENEQSNSSGIEKNGNTENEAEAEKDQDFEPNYEED